MPLLSPSVVATAPFSAGASVTRTFGTTYTNGVRRRLVVVAVSTTTTATASAYCGFSTTTGGTVITQTQVVGGPAGVGATINNSFAFMVDPGATYSITTALGAGAASSINTTMEIDY